MAEFRTRLNGAGDRGTTAENMEKSQPADFNEDTTNNGDASSFMACYAGSYKPVAYVVYWTGHWM